MQRIVTGLGLACLIGLAAYIVLALSCSGCGCFGPAYLLPFVGLAFIAVGLLGAAIWSEERERGMRLGRLFQFVVITVGAIAVLAITVLFLAR